MKNIRSAFLPVFMLIGVVGANNGSAQMQTMAGVQVGVNIANVSYTSTMSGVSKSARTGLLLGGILEIGVSDKVCLRAEPMYVQSGAKMDISIGASRESGDQSMKAIYLLEYLEIPVHVKWQIGAGVVRPYIFTGPNLGVLLAATLEEEIPPPAVPAPEYRESGTRDIRDRFTSTNFAVDFGAGVTYDVAVDIQLNMDVRYSFGLSNIAKPPDPNDQSFQPDSWKSRDIRVLVGVLFAL
jgi:opacity protein-like surface antigen